MQALRRRGACGALRNSLLVGHIWNRAPLLGVEGQPPAGRGRLIGRPGAFNLENRSVEHRTVESKCLHNYPGRGITPWGSKGQKEDRWVEIRLESRFPPTVSASWQTACPRIRRPLEKCVLQGQCLDRCWAATGGGWRGLRLGRRLGPLPALPARPAFLRAHISRACTPSRAPAEQVTLARERLRRPGLEPTLLASSPSILNLSWPGSSLV